MVEVLDSKFVDTVKDKLAFIFRDVLFYYTFLAILFKSIIFLGFVIDGSHSKTDFMRAFYSVPSLAVYSCFVLVLLSFAFLFKGRARIWFYVVFNALVSFLMLMDLWYFRGFGTLLSFHQLKQTANLDNLGGSILSMFRPMDVILVFDVVLLVVIVLLSKNPYKRVNRNVFVFSLLFVASVAFIAYTHYKVDIVEKGQKQILFRICWTPNQTISNLSVLGYHIYDSYNYWKECQPVVLKPEEKKHIKQWFEDKKESLPDNEYKALFKGKNLIFIQVESLEAFVLNQKINGQEITPNLNKLLGNSLYFSEVNEQVYNGTSSDADLMINTSVYPVRRGSTFFRYPNNTYNSMPKLLQKQGYSTLAIHPDKGAFWNWMPALKSIGYQKCIDYETFEHDEFIGLGLSDGSYFRQVAPIVLKQKQPFFTFMVTLTSHAPFDIPAQYRELKLDEQLDKTKLGGYFQSVRYTDKHIGNFLSQLEKGGLLDNTVVVIYGDHCGIHKYYPDELQTIKPSEDWWLRYNKRIPFIIYSKQLKGKEINITGGQIDILPTVAYLMGVDEKDYIDTAMGRNLLKTKKDFAVLANEEYIGVRGSEKEVKDAVEGINIADRLISSDYFKDMEKEDK